MVNITDLPAKMPGTMKEQLLALAPYMTDYCEKRGGGFVIDMKIPIDAFLTFYIDHNELGAYGMALTVEVPAPNDISSGFCGHVLRQPQFAEVQLTYL